MFGRGYARTHRTLFRHVLAALATWILLPGVAAAQQSPPAALNLSAPAIAGYLSEVLDVRRITLREAQQLAQGTSDPLKRLGELQVEAARQHRLGVRSMYFPSIATQFLNLHMSEQPGELLTFERPLSGALISVPVNVLFQNQTLFNVVATQPITQLFAVHQLTKIARADENIARAKAGMPVAAATRQIERNFFDLLVAQRELAAATADARRVRTGDTSMVLLAGDVTTLTASLNELLGLAPTTRLELIPPPPLAENLTLRDALAQAQASPSLEVIEAEQTAAKAHAAARLTKLEYVPGVAVMGGWLRQDAVSETVLPESFAYVGVLATYTLFNGMKREHAIKEAAAQAQAADLGVQLTKAKAAAAVKTAYFELERSRNAYYLARQLLTTTPAGVRFVSDNSDADSRRARTDAVVFRAEIAYREAYAALTSLLAGK